MQQEMSAMKESLEVLGKELAVVEQEEAKLRSQEVDIKHEVEKYETVLKENQQKIKHWQKEVCLHLITWHFRILWHLNFAEI